jgi:predicted enzyme related to lactoylglutathione lyase|tara:strand:- start:17 stop:418 length:402 start_codon:yes stop_codon:yes gene_type:complete
MVLEKYVKMITMIRFRYIVNNVDEVVEFYRSNFDFKLEEKFGSAIAILERDGVRLLISGPMASASKPMSDGTKPSPGKGWSRMVITVEDIEIVVSQLKKNGVQFKNDLMDNQGRKQILCLDPSENIIELFQQD